MTAGGGGMLNLVSLFGWIVLAGLAWVVGGCRRPVPWRTVLGSAALILVLGAVMFALPPSRTALLWVNDAVVAVLDAGQYGARFLLGPLALDPGEETSAGEPSIGFILGAQALPAVIFFAALMAALYHLRVIQPVVRGFALLFHRTLRLSGAESLAGSSNIFVGAESALTVRPYLESMTRSELLTVLTCAMSTVASTTLAIYVMFLQDTFPNIAGHVISASVLSIPTAALVSKLILPEDGSPVTLGRVPPNHGMGKHSNTISALTAGSWDGLKLAAGIATLLIAVLGLVAVLDLALLKATEPFADSIGGPLSISRMLGWLFTPLAWLLGIESAEAVEAGRLLGERSIMTEIPAYRRLGELAATGAVSPRTLLVLSYALCGFAHVASVGIFVGGIAALAPSRRDDLAALGLRALAGATLATLMTGALAGLFYWGQTGILGL
jgi:CNT family concentrative nucleoside transporter